MSQHLDLPRCPWGSEANPTRREKVEVELIFDLRDEKKPQSYPLRYNEDFFSSQKFEEQRKIRFRSRGGFASLPLGFYTNCALKEKGGGGMQRKSR
jgi:hypothetical protein